MRRRSFYIDHGKRWLDLICAGAGLVVLAPLLGATALAVRLLSGPPSLFVQERVGVNGRTFPLYKFRTMVSDADRSGSVTVANDPRLTPVGALLRKWKVDELPQLWNVLVGDMSLVGPRPEVEEYAKLLAGPAAVILGTRPGLTGPATLAFRHEEEILAVVDDAAAHSEKVLFPIKIRMNVQYLDDCSLRFDLVQIVTTILAVSARR